MNNKLKEYVNDLEEETSQIAGERKEKLGELADFIREKLKDGKTSRLTFICTHNSRRSHLCQIWAATLAEHVGLEGIETYSGGTEGTAFNPRAVAAIKRAGFKVEDPGGENPRYKVFLVKMKNP